MILTSWQDILRLTLTGVLAYGGLIAILRLSGKRTLSKLSAFDFVVTVALGSSLATILLSRSTPLLEGIAGVALLVGLQFAISWLSARWRPLRSWIKSEPVFVFRQGRFLEAAMKAERLARDDVLAAIRKAGVADCDDVLAVILEPDGTLSVVPGRTMPPRARSSLPAD